MSDRIADVLAAGREYLEKHGWWKGGLRGPNGQQACAVGAILFSQNLGSQDLEDIRVESAVNALALVIEPGEWNPFNTEQDIVMSWNDREDRTKQQVLDVFAKAEKIERAGFDPDA